MTFRPCADANVENPKLTKSRVNINASFTFVASNLLPLFMISPSTLVSFGLRRQALFDEAQVCPQLTRKVNGWKQFFLIFWNNSS